MRSINPRFTYLLTYLLTCQIVQWYFYFHLAHAFCNLANIFDGWYIPLWQHWVQTACTMALSSAKLQYCCFTFSVSSYLCICCTCIPRCKAEPSNSIWPYLSSDLVRTEREYC